MYTCQSPKTLFLNTRWQVKLGQAHVRVWSDSLLCRMLVHLSRAGAEVQIFAPDIPQMHVIDHTKGQPSEGETRYGPHLVALERARVETPQEPARGCFVLAGSRVHV